jgi:hypothetical protein
MRQCETINYLQAKSKWGDKVAELASAALVVIRNIDEANMTDADVHYLHDVVQHVYEEGGKSMLEDLRYGAKDCKICAELVKQIEALEV